MHKVTIPGPVYIIIGAAMVLMSVFIDYEKLSLFVLVGAVFIVIGFMKVIMREKKETHKHVTQHKHPAHHAHSQQGHQTGAAHPHAQHQHPHPQHQHTPAHHNQKLQAPQRHAAHQAEKAKHMKQESVFRCSGCGVKLHPMFRFCPNCGHKLK